jgi:ActR/RegA family two-component response regulator
MNNSAPPKERILVVDDAPDTIEVLQRNLQAGGYQVHTAQSVEEAIRVLESIAVDLVITDLKMPKVSGLELVQHVRENYANAKVMMITGYPTIGGAVDAVKMGAEDYLSKAIYRRGTECSSGAHSGEAPGEAGRADAAPSDATDPTRPDWRV